MRHEVAAVWRSAFGPPQCVFQRCQGTNPPAEFDQHGPGDSGHVNPDHTGPPDGEQPAEDDEDDECEVKKYDEVCGDDYFSRSIEASNCSKFFCWAAIVFDGPVSLKKTLPPGPSAIAPINR